MEKYGCIQESYERIFIVNYTDEPNRQRVYVYCPPTAPPTLGQYITRGKTQELENAENTKIISLFKNCAFSRKSVGL